MGLTESCTLQLAPAREVSLLRPFPPGLGLSITNHETKVAHRANLETRLYYGSGERRWLMRNPSMQSLAESSPSRPGSSFATGSPAEDHGPSNIWNPRRRPRTAPAQDDQEASVEGMSTTEGVEVLRLGPKKKTSSVWSPHLRFDRRAIRYSIFEPPSMPWTPEGGMFGLVNIQVLLFAVGFGLPLGT